MEKAHAAYHLGDVATVNAALSKVRRILKPSEQYVIAPLLVWAGRTDEASELLEETGQRERTGEYMWLLAPFLASFHLGDFDRAMYWLRKAILDRGRQTLEMIRVATCLAALRQHQDFEEQLQLLECLETRTSHFLRGSPVAGTSYGL